MAFADFTLERVETELGVIAKPGTLFPGLKGVAVPGWLTDMLGRGMQLAMLGEKARSEFIVAPILLAVRELSGNRVSILSGQRLDVDPRRGLVGECNFILALSEPMPRLRAPIATVVEAKKQDIEAGLGQCVAQMFAARLFNERSAQVYPAIYGCVTSGETWQFLCLTGTNLTYDQPRLNINDVGDILAAFAVCVQQATPANMESVA
jgi:hypothetical protein